MAWSLTACREVPPELTVSETAALACQSLVNLLPVAGRLKLSESTGNLTSEGLKLMLKVLPEGDLYRGGGKAADSIRPFGWARLLQLGAGDGAPHQVLRELWQRYLKTKAFDEFDRISAIHGWQKKRRRVTPVAPRRQALAATLAALPPDVWVTVDDFFSLVLATGNDFEVAKDPASLYVGGSEWFGNLARHALHLCWWEVVQGRYALAFLMEYAGTLGVIDLAYRPAEWARGDFRGFYGTEDWTHLSRYDGLAYIRLNSLGQYILGLTESYVPALPVSAPCLGLDGLLVRGTAVPSAVRLLLDSFAVAVPEGWQLSMASLAGAAQRVSLAEVETLLERYSGGGLPPAVRALLEQCRARFASLQDRGTARLVEVAPQLLDRLLGDVRMRKLCLRAGDRHLVIPAAHEEAVRKLLGEQGYPIGSLDVAAPASDWDRLERELEAGLQR